MELTLMLNKRYQKLTACYGLFIKLKPVQDEK